MLIGISITFVLALAVVLFVVFYQRKLYHQNLEMAELKARQKKEQIAAALSAQEQERQRIARDLHDEVGATLSTAKLLVSNIKGNDALNTVQNMLTTTIQNLRNISHNLLPPTLQDFGLVTALQARLDALEKSERLRINFVHSLTARLDQNQEVQLYRIVNELLNNTLKHAGATFIQIVLKPVENRIELNYVDNGTGMPAELAKTGGGLGFRNLRNRVEILGGEYSIHTNPGKGFAFQLIFQTNNNTQHAKN